MAPLRHAVRFVDREQRYARGALNLFKQTHAALRQQALGCHIDQVDLAGSHALLDVTRLGCSQGRIEGRRADPEFLQCRHLILHQRDQR